MRLAKDTLLEILAADFEERGLGKSEAIRKALSLWDQLFGMEKSVEFSGDTVLAIGKELGSTNLTRITPRLVAQVVVKNLGMGKETSLAAGEQQIRDAFMRKFGPADAPLPETEDFSVREVYKDHVIVSFKGKLYKFPFRQEGDKVDFSGDFTEVENVYSPIKLIRELADQQQPRHPLSGMAGAPAPTPAVSQAVSKESVALGLSVLKEGGSYSPADGVLVKRGKLPNMYYVHVASQLRPATGWQREMEWPASVWVRETGNPTQAVQQAMAAVAVSQKEVETGHPLRRMFGSRDRTSVTHTISQAEPVSKEQASKKASLRKRLVAACQRGDKRIGLLRGLTVYPNEDLTKFKLQWTGTWQPAGFKQDDFGIYYAVTSGGVDQIMELVMNCVNQVRAPGK